MTVVAVVAIIAFFVLFGLYVWDDIQKACREAAAEEVGAGRHSPCSGEFRGLTAAGADTYTREWTLARSGPYDRESDVA